MHQGGFFLFLLAAIRYPRSFVGLSVSEYIGVMPGGLVRLLQYSVTCSLVCERSEINKNRGNKRLDQAAPIPIGVMKVAQLFTALTAIAQCSFPKCSLPRCSVPSRQRTRRSLRISRSASVLNGYPVTTCHWRQITHDPSTDQPSSPSLAGWAFPLIHRITVMAASPTHRRPPGSLSCSCFPIFLLRPLHSMRPQPTAPP